MKTIAMIPVKTNNERLPGKNTLPFSDGTPLMILAQKAILASGAVDEVFVFCSDESIKEFCIDGVNFLLRPETLDTNSTSWQDLMSAFAQVIDADIYINAHVTSPFVLPERYSACVEAVKSGAHDSAFAAHCLHTFLWDSSHSPINFNPSKLPRTQDLSPIYAESHSVYAYTKDVWRRLHRRVGTNPFIVGLNSIESVDVDTPEDYALARAVYDAKLYER
jgi:CMP-N-acetylneuraminic acid synthetase